MSRRTDKMWNAAMKATALSIKPQWEVILEGWSLEKIRGMRLVWDFHRDKFIHQTFAEFLQYMAERAAQEHLS